MPDKKLGVELIARERISSQLSKVANAVKKTGSTFSGLKKTATDALMVISQKVFFVREALSTLRSVVQGLFDAFVAPAIATRKLEQSLTNVFGDAGVADKIRKFSRDTGMSFGAVAKAALDMGNKLQNIGGLDKYLAAIKRVGEWRPDLGAEGAINYVNNIIAKLGEATEGGEKQLGRYTAVVTGGVKGRAIDLAKELDKLGVVAKVVDPATTALDRLREAWEQFKAKVGAKILDKLAEAAIKLLKYLEENEDVLLKLTDVFIDLVNKGLQALIDWIDKGGLEDLIKQSQEWMKILQGILDIVMPIMQVVGTVGKALVKLTPSITGLGPLMTGMRAGTGKGPGELLQAAGRGVELYKQDVGELLKSAGGFMQQVKVLVGIDPNNGSVQPYVSKEIGQNNSDMMEGWRGA